MKAGSCKMWRPFLGVTVVSALAIAVTVQGGPRDGSLRTERGAKAGTSRLLSGPADTIRAGVVAGTPTAVIQLTPKADNPSGPYGHGGYYSAADISGRRLTVAGGGGRTFWNGEVLSWGLAQRIRSYEVRVNSMALLGSSADCGGGPGSCVGAGDLTNAVEPCSNPGACITSFGETGAGCDGTKCDFAWVSVTNPGWLFGVNANPGVFAVPNSGCGVLDPAGANCFGAVLGSESQIDDGRVAYLATYAFDVPANAKGLYTLDWVAPDSSTFLGDDASPPDKIFLAAAIPGELSITVGACCTDLGAGTCVDGLTSSECDAVLTTNARVFSPDATCPGSGGANDLAECPSCTSDADCNDQDACTDDVCNLAFFACSNTPITTWDQATQCCDAVTGNLTTPVNANVCSVASCSIGTNRGVAIQTAVAAGDPCNGVGDDNPCTFDDICAADESCSGTDVTTSAIACTTDQDCVDATGLSAPACVSGMCECSLVPDLTFAIDASGTADPLCFNGGDKITATVNVAAATAPVNGGQFLINYDPSCMRFNSASGAGAYTDLVFGPVVDDAAGTIFVVVGVGFGVGDGPAGNASMVSLSFTKMGLNACDSCNLCFSSNNPRNTYLVDNAGLKIGVNPVCSDTVIANDSATLVVPDSIKTNVDCGQPTAIEAWAAPTASDTCANATVTCLEQHQSETSASPARLTGGEFTVGATNFCCAVSTDRCGTSVGSPGSPASALSDTGGDGCWTVEVNDQTALDITIGLSPTANSPPADGLTRGIKFTLYPNTIQTAQVVRFCEPIEFGGGLDIPGKSKDALKIPGHGNWDCITAWDQLHTLRSCYLFNPGDCADGRLEATFRGDPAFGGNWLVGGNLDGYQKSGATPDAASLFTIDVIDYGLFVSQFGADYGTGNTDCDTAGPHADIDGDGLVTTDDFTFISMNFLTSVKSCCGADNLPAVAGTTSITIQELRRRGMGNLAVADLNGDGVLNVDDMNAFMQGARPSVKSGSLRKGTR